MGLNTFSAALSGLAINSMGLNVVGNNLANLNTVGFKASTISFTDVLGQTFSTGGTAASGNVVSIGLGAQVGSVRQAMGQGTFQTTNNPLDAAIQGKGFFVVKNNNGQFYTRAGNFHLDANGMLVSDNGSNVQGYMRNPVTGQVDPTLGITDIKVPAGIDSPVMTSEFGLAMNLDAGAPNGTDFTTQIQVYDSLGKAHIATLSMKKEISGGATPVTKWRFDITIPNNEIAGVAASNTEQFSLITGAVVTGDPAAGALVFDNAGKLTSAYTGPDPATLPALADLTFPGSSVTLPALANGATLSPTMTWQLMAGPVTPNITGFANPSEVTASTQNGAPAGSMTNLAIGPDGTISAIFNNGKTAEVAQIVLANFTNLDGLIPQGGGVYAESIGSGAVMFGAPGEGSRGQIVSSALEQSNVDLATELTRIITYQRGYQANARMVTVTDQIMQETMNMRQ
jgi:flagellar hook protein FlgE